MGLRYGSCPRTGWRADCQDTGCEHCVTQRARTSTTPSAGASLEEWENWAGCGTGYRMAGSNGTAALTREGEQRTSKTNRSLEEMCREKKGGGRIISSKIAKAGLLFDNYGVSPVVRQTLQHWAYQPARTLTKRRKGSNSSIRCWKTCKPSKLDL